MEDFRNNSPKNFRLQLYSICAASSKSSTVFTGLKVVDGISTKTEFQFAIEPFQRPGSSWKKISCPLYFFFTTKNLLSSR